MSEKLRSLGLDVGTTSTQMVLSELEIENRAGAFSVPEMEIAERRVIYRGQVHFTPLLEGDLVDAEGLQRIVDKEFRRAGVSRESVDTGAIIITGETSRKENARAVLESLAGYAGEFVVATAGPNLESVLAAKGAGAVDYSRQTGHRVLHMDIGGGTSNLALIEDGHITATGCLNVGGRLVKVDDTGRITYVSPVAAEVFSKKVGDFVCRQDLENLAEILTEALEMAAGLRETTPLLEHFWTGEAGPVWAAKPGEAVISFSGGVADCIGEERAHLAYGDLGPELGRTIRRSRLCRGEFVLGRETIRATVIGAGCHSAQLSGSTVFYQNIHFPLKNLPVVEKLTDLPGLDGPGVLALGRDTGGGYRALRQLAEEISVGFGQLPVILAMEQDLAKALGQLVALRLGPGAQILCIDRVKLGQGDYLDVAAPVGPALPVVVKTLILSR